MEAPITPRAVLARVADTPLDEELRQIDAVQRAQQEIDTVVAGYVRQALRVLSIPAAEIEAAEDVDEIKNTLRTLGIPAAKTWWIQLLARIAKSAAGTEDSPAALLDDLRDKLPFYDIELDLIQRVGNRLQELIQTDGTTAIVQTLFSDDVMSRWYTQSVTYDVFNRLSRESLRCILDSLDHPVRVIEVGAGTGGLTANLLDLFDPQSTQYSFTDVGAFFLRSARRRFTEFPFVQYKRLDLEQPYPDQGFPPESCDLIIANNVIHDTRNVSFTLTNLVRTLAPGGMMLMVELTDPQTWWHMCFGSLEGWWRFKSDATDAREDLMLLKREQWLEMLGESGFDETAVISDALPVDFANRLFLSQVPNRSSSHT